MNVSLFLTLLLFLGILKKETSVHVAVRFYKSINHPLMLHVEEGDVYVCCSDDR